MRALAVQIAGLKRSLHAEYPARVKSSCENKDVGKTGSRALYLALRGAVNREEPPLKREALAPDVV
ncbi:MAG TPA: hypothetical protein VFL84_03795, partial [Gammaproteobacteria bacterium]|nr:hypothetical protein [Gammaproteobacteria bacterium]